MFFSSSCFLQVNYMRSDCVTSAIHALVLPLTLEASCTLFHTADLLKCVPA